MADAPSARYVYAVARGLDDGVLAGAVGIAGSALAVVAHAGLHAVVSDVPLEEFDEEPLRRNLEDLRWVEDVARAHDDVVRAAHQGGTVAPLSLATIFLDDDGVRDRLIGDGDRLHAALDAVEGCDEYSVKVLHRPRSAGEPAARDRPASGADYLRRKREAATSRVDSERAAQEAATRTHDQLAAASVAARLLAPQDPRLSGLEGVMTLNAAYLVPREGSDRFAAAVEAARADGADPAAHEIAVAGPWPPYSFVVLDGP